jgi:hypothetical protein
MLSITYLFEDAKPDLAPGEYVVPKIDKSKEQKINPRTGRSKKFKTIAWLKTKIPPEERSFKNIPKFSTGKNRVRPQDWLEIDAQKRSPSHTATSWGWSSNGKCYGWSHRAIYGFAVGDEVKPGTCGFDKLKKPFKIKDRAQCEEVAKKFAEGVS